MGTVRERFSKLDWPIVFRVVLAVLFGLRIVWFIIQAGPNAMRGDVVATTYIMMVVAVIVLVGIPTLITARGLTKRKPKTVWFVVACDVLIGAAVLSFSISAYCKTFVTPAFPTLGGFLFMFWSVVLFPQHHYEPNRLSDVLMIPAFAAFALALIAEAVYLLRQMQVGRKTWSVCACAAAAILALSLGSKWIQSRQLNPLLAYTRAHWIDIPKGSDVRLRDEQGYSCSLEILEPNKTFITIWLNQQDWKRLSHPAWELKEIAKIKGAHPPVEHHVVVKEHRGRWYFVGDQHPSDGWECLVAGSSAWHAHPVKTADDALRLVRDVGVSDPGLQKIEDQTMYRGKRTFCFWSPRALGTYVVLVGEGRVHLFLRDSVDIR